MFLRHYWKERQIIGLEVIWLECLPLFKFYPEREIYQSKYGQNLQLLLPLLYNKKCGFIDKPHMNYNQQENSLTKTNVEKE